MRHKYTRIFFFSFEFLKKFLKVALIFIIAKANNQDSQTHEKQKYFVKNFEIEIELSRNFEGFCILRYSVTQSFQMNCHLWTERGSRGQLGL